MKVPVSFQGRKLRADGLPLEVGGSSYGSRYMEFSIEIAINLHRSFLLLPRKVKLNSMEEASTNFHGTAFFFRGI